jgi:hypothetical protein
MTAHLQADKSAETSVAATFDVLAWEIELAGARCIFLDKLIGDLLPTIPDEHRQALIEGMHAVDLLAQHLTSLSAFARKMSESVPVELLAPVQGALGDITLGALADRMATAFGAEEKPGDDSDELDLF